MLRLTDTFRFRLETIILHMNIYFDINVFSDTVSHYICWGEGYMVHSIGFHAFFVQAFKIVVDSWKFTMLLQYILWDNRPIFMISALHEQLQQQLEYTLLKPDCKSWWISKMQSDTLEERYAIKFCFKLGKNDTTETYGMLQTAFWPSCMNQASVFEWHKRFKEGRESMSDDERCGRSKEVNTPDLIGQRLGLGLLCWGFKGVQEEIPREEASILQIGSVAFPAGQCTSPQLHPCLCDSWLFPKPRDCRYETIEEMKEAVMKVINTVTQEDFHGSFQKFLERYNKCIAAGGDYLKGD